MCNLCNVLLYLVDESIGVPLGVVLLGADSVCDVVLVVLDKPHSVVGLELLALLVLEFHRLDLIEDLDECACTVAESEVRLRLSFSLVTSSMSWAVEYRARPTYLIFIRNITNFT